MMGALNRFSNDVRVCKGGSDLERVGILLGGFKVDDHPPPGMVRGDFPQCGMGFLDGHAPASADAFQIFQG